MRWRRAGLWPGFWTGVVAGGLGLLVLTGAYAVQTHAARGTVLPPGEVFESAGGQPVHVVGVLGPGPVGEPAVCLAGLRSGTSERIEVGVRRSRSRSIPEGRRLPSETVSVTCDQRFAVNTGPVVLAYPLAGSSALFASYLAIAVVGSALAGHELRARRAAGRGHTAAVASRPVTIAGRQHQPSKHSWRRSLLTVAFLLAVTGSLTMLTLSVALSSHRHGELLLNLVLLVVVIPAALGATMLLRRPRDSRRP